MLESFGDPTWKPVDDSVESTEEEGESSDDDSTGAASEDLFDSEASDAPDEALTTDQFVDLTSE